MSAAGKACVRAKSAFLCNMHIAMLRPHLHFKGPREEVVLDEQWLHMRVYTCNLKRLLLCILRRDGDVNIRKTCIYNMRYLHWHWTRFRPVKVSPQLLLNRENILKNSVLLVKYLPREHFCDSRRKTKGSSRSFVLFTL